MGFNLALLLVAQLAQGFAQLDGGLAQALHFQPLHIQLPGQRIDLGAQGSGIVIGGRRGGLGLQAGDQRALGIQRGLQGGDFGGSARIGNRIGFGLGGIGQRRQPIQPFPDAGQRCGNPPLQLCQFAHAVCLSILLAHRIGPWVESFAQAFRHISAKIAAIAPPIGQIFPC